MTEKINLKEIERKAYTSYHQDGLADIFASIYILAFAIGILLDYLYDFSMGVILPGMLVAIVVPLWISAKKKITIPRMGYVNFGAKGNFKLAGLFGGILGLGVAVFFIFGLLEGPSPWLDFVISNGMLMFGIGALIVCSLFAYASGLKRLYTYGIVAFVLLAAGHFLGIFFAYILLVLGLIIMATGFALLARFIKKYPLKGD